MDSLKFFYPYSGCSEARKTMIEELDGAMLTGVAIEHAMGAGMIEITPFDHDQLNPNSYNLKLHPQLKVYDLDYNNGEYLDMNKPNPSREIVIPEDGYILKPGILYIGRTVERTYSESFIPMINGRSSGGRLGISIHVCAGFGDIGFDGTWTLEITVVHPVKVYPYAEIAQVCFFTPAHCLHDADIVPYHGKYQCQVDATESKFYLDNKG
jgi:dCTP deaminase